MADDWKRQVANEIANQLVYGPSSDFPSPNSYITNEDYKCVSDGVRRVIDRLCPFKDDVTYMEAKEPPLLQCIECKNTESCAGAMARYFNQGRCLHCGGYFKVVRA